jgi:predicted DNA-binding transcriptional regulator AlpA
MRRTEAEFQLAKGLIVTGLSDYKVAARMGIPRSTVFQWRRRDDAPRQLRGSVEVAAWTVSDPVAYLAILEECV